MIRLLATLMMGGLMGSVMAQPADTFPACTNELHAEALAKPRVSQSRSVEEPDFRASPKLKSVHKGRAASEAATRPRVPPVVTAEVLEKQRIYLERAKAIAASHDGSKDDLDRKLRTLKLDLFTKSGSRQEQEVH